MSSEADPGPRASRLRGFMLHVLPAVGYAAGIFYGGSVRPPRLPRIAELAADKLLHCLVFAGMQILVLRAVRWEWPALGLGRQIGAAAAISALAGALLEVYQAFLPNRSAELLDFVADVAGILLASVVLVFAMRDRSHL